MQYALVKKANKYAQSVVNGDVLACKWVRLAAKRHLDDLQKSKDSKEFPYYFDPKSAERVIKFIQNFSHTKGKWAAKAEKLILEPWQCFFISCAFGWRRRSNDTRRYRRVLLFVPRKNGKSALAAPIGHYMLAADGEYGAEVYSGATTEKQAWEVFRPAKIMASKQPDFLSYYGVEVNASNICIQETGARFEPIIGNPGDGSSPHLAIIDEYHEHDTDRMVDTMETGMGAREQPMMLIITTAGDNTAGPCYQLQLDAQKMLEGSISDDGQTFALIYTVDQGDDWANPDSLRKANPNFGVSVSEEFLLARLHDAKSNSRKQSVFQTKHLNIWVGSRDAYFNVDKWRSCGDSSLTFEQFHGQKCYIGLDLASKVDIAALEILIPHGDNQYTRFGRYYLPENTVNEGSNEHYQGWMRDGLITVTDGDIIDFNRIKEDILDICSVMQVEEVAYDPFQATMLVTDLMAHGVPVIEMRPTVLNFSEPMKHLDGIIRAGLIRHNNDPVMTWMISNVTAKEDAKENVYPRKERPENKIDGAVALMMALGRCMNDDGQDLDHALDNLISVKL